MTNQALVIGINKYITKPLRWSVADARGIGQLLSDTSSFNVITLTDEQAHRSNILKEIEHLTKTDCPVKVLYLAGHATLTSNGVHFVSYDATEWPDMVSFSEIARVLTSNLHRQQSLLIICDCCHAGALEVSSATSTQQLRDALSGAIDQPNIVSLLACTIGANAREDPNLQHGIFTYYIINGLLGAAADSDGKVTTEAVYLYAAKQLEKSSYQKPVYKANVSGRFVLIEKAKLLWYEKQVAEKDIFDDLTNLKAVLTHADERLAELKPPFKSRQDYKTTGWRQAAKIVQGVADKKSRILQRWATRLDGFDNWLTLSEEINSLLADIANINIGTVTEFGLIEAKLGEGGFGTVYRVAAEEKVLAFKIYHPHELNNLAKLERFRIGYRAMDLLDHPRIVKVHKFQESPLSFYMDYIDGQNLRKWYGAEQDEAELIRILISIVQTVEYAHGTGVLHRDIKPENVILQYNQGLARWEPILTDFDLAWFAAATSHTVEAFGAPFYAAPEQLSDPGRTVAHQFAVDIYSLAMLGIYMITGKDPVVPDEAFMALKSTVSRWKSQSAANLLTTTLQRAGNRKPESRISEARELRSALLEVQNRLTASSDPSAKLDDQDFFNHIGVILGFGHEQAARLSTFSSASGRTEISVRWRNEILAIGIQKRGQLLAQGTNFVKAKNGLRRRIDERLNELKAQTPQNTNIERHRPSGNEGIPATLIELKGLPKTTIGSSFAAKVISELVPIYEQY